MLLGSFLARKFKKFNICWYIKFVLLFWVVKTFGNAIKTLKISYLSLYPSNKVKMQTLDFNRLLFRSRRFVCSIVFENRQKMSHLKFHFAYNFIGVIQVQFEFSRQKLPKLYLKILVAGLDRFPFSNTVKMSKSN